MNNTATLIPSDQVIIAAKGNHITAADISRALFYANSWLLAMHLHVDKSFSTAMSGYAETFYTLMKWEMEVGSRPCWYSLALIFPLSYRPLYHLSSIYVLSPGCPL
jgi:hypothetical protein